jgi:hypothetical protein
LRESAPPQEIFGVSQSSMGINGASEVLAISPSLLRWFALRNGRGEAADGPRLAGKADVGADRRLAAGAARAVDAFVGPAAAVGRALLHRETGSCAARRDFDLGGISGSRREERRNCDNKDDETTMAHAVSRVARQDLPPLDCRGAPGR